MIFNKLFKRSKPSPEKSSPQIDSTLEPTIPSEPPLITQNQEVFDELVTFLDFAEGFKIGFVEINFGRDTTVLIEALREHPQCQTIFFTVLNLSNPYLRFLRDEIVKELSNISAPSDQKLVLIIRGLENSIGMTGDYPPMLQDLNYIRDAFTQSVPHPILFFLPDYALTRLARFAPDFWDWRSGVFRFRSSTNSQDAAFMNTLNSSRIHGSYTLLEWKARIDNLQRLAMEYRPNMNKPIQGRLKNYVRVLIELGIGYRHIGEVTKAQEQFGAAIVLSEHQQGLEKQHAVGLDELGDLKAQQGAISEAIDLYQRSLNIFACISDLQGTAATLHALGILKSKQGEISEAIDLYQQSLDINERIGNLQDTGATLHRLGVLKAEQGEPLEAIDFYQRSLGIVERTGDLQGTATILHSLGVLKANQGEISEAIDLCQKSLKIHERIGYSHGRAFALWNLGNLIAQQGDVVTAIVHLQESIDLFEKLGMPEAEKVRQDLVRVQEQD